MTDDRPPEAKRLELARIERGFDDAKAAAKFFGWNYDTYIQHERGERGLYRAAGKYSAAYRVSEAWLLTGQGDKRRTIPIVGKVGAGPDGSVLFAEGQGNFGEAPLPPDAAEHTVAGEVEGDSVRGIAEDGWLVYWDDVRNPPSDNMIGSLCIVGLADGRVLIKFLHRGRGSGLFDLESTNAPVLRDVIVEWCALVTAIVPRRINRAPVRRRA